MLSQQLRSMAGRWLARMRAMAQVLRPARDIWALNIGGGPHFWAPGWYNLDAATSWFNPHSFNFSPASVFPLADASLKLVFTSHTLEHLDDATVGRILTESRRVIAEEGALLIKLPDFDRALAAWRQMNASFFVDDYWGFQAVNQTWMVRGVADTLDARAAMIFCGFWNAAYGDHFSGRIHRGPTAYHGPPVLTPTEVEAAKLQPGPHEVSVYLRTLVAERESSFTYNHQNSWSSKQLSDLLARHGWRVVTTDVDLICRQWPAVPGLADHLRAQSMYCWAVPV